MLACELRIEKLTEYKNTPVLPSNAHFLGIASFALVILFKTYVCLKSVMIIILEIKRSLFYSSRSSLQKSNLLWNASSCCLCSLPFSR